jgi:hypothetical protein
VAANPALAAKITVLNLCISDKAGTLTMRGVPGSSMSQIAGVAEDAKAAKDKKREEWSVDCVTLPQFVESIGADPKNLVLKVDTEGAWTTDAGLGSGGKRTLLRPPPAHLEDRPPCCRIPPLALQAPSATLS